MIDQRQRLGDAGAWRSMRTTTVELDGLVLEDQLWAIPIRAAAVMMLTQLMMPFTTLAKAGLDEDLSTVLPRLNPREAGRHRVERRQAAGRRAAEDGWPSARAARARDDERSAADALRAIRRP